MAAGRGGARLDFQDSCYRLAVWSDVTEKIADEMFVGMKELDRSGCNFNPAYGGAGNSRPAHAAI
ncbi:MAG: hypothetical protein M3541_20700 [Acidobacteriota bacterium]|nr:hypothetical protein [Acidobacteriota bacterium]